MFGSRREGEEKEERNGREGEEKEKRRRRETGEKEKKRRRETGEKEERRGREGGEKEGRRRFVNIAEKVHNFKKNACALAYMEKLLYLCTFFMH